MCSNCQDVYWFFINAVWFFYRYFVTLNYERRIRIHFTLQNRIVEVVFSPYACLCFLRACYFSDTFLIIWHIMRTCHIPSFKCQLLALLHILYLIKNFLRSFLYFDLIIPSHILIVSKPLFHELVVYCTLVLFIIHKSQIDSYIVAITPSEIINF